MRRAMVGRIYLMFRYVVTGASPTMAVCIARMA